MISQLTVFLQNEKGHLASACRIIADAGINMHALFLADTQDFGIARIFCDKPDEASALLADAGYRATVTPVIAVRIEHAPGALAKFLEFCDSNDMNLEYGYCFSVDDTAVDVLKVDADDGEEKLVAGGFEIVPAEEIYALS